MKILWFYVNIKISQNVSQHDILKTRHVFKRFIAIHPPLLSVSYSTKVSIQPAAPTSEDSNMAAGAAGK